jgi:nucleoside phosphorylase
MIFITIALKAEADALIEQFNLKLFESKPFSIYKNKNIILIISRVGKVEASIASTYLCTKFDAKEDDKFLNIGICGTFKDDKIGDMFLIKKIVDECSNSVIHLTKSDNFTQKSLLCSSKPLANISSKKYDLVDMERFGFVKSAKKFIKHENIIILKVVSDKISDQIPTDKFIKELMKKNMRTIELFVK